MAGDALAIGDVAYRMNLISAFFGAVTVTAVYLAGMELATGQDTRGGRPSWAFEIGAILGAVALAVSPVFWSLATVAEVYTLNSALIALLLWALLRLGNVTQQRAANRSPADADRPDTDLRRLLLVIAVLFGLGLAHHRTMVLLVPAIAVVVWRARRFLTARLELLAALLAPLLLYIYLPLRGHIGSLDGTYTNTLGGFLRYVTASGYGTFILDNPMSVGRGVSFYPDLFVQQFGGVGVVAGLLGLVVVSRRRLTGGITEVAFASFGIFNLFYRVADIEVFFLPMFVVWALWLGHGVDWLLALAQSRLASAPPANPRRPASNVFGAAIVVVCAAQSALIFHNNYPQRDRSGDWSVYDYGMDIVSQSLAPHAAVVGIQGEVTLIRYFQSTQGLRPDLLPIAMDQPDRRLTAVTHLLDQGYAVYLTRELAGAPERWSLDAAGPLIRVRPQADLIAPETSTALNASIVPEIVLYGYAIMRPSGHAPLPPLRLNLTWHVLAPLSRDLKVSARLLSPDGQSIAQADAVPVHFAYPTTAWRSGEFITDVYDLRLPERLAGGQYTPLVILYDPAQGAAEVGRLTLPPVYLP